jgi:hypothetical protein
MTAAALSSIAQERRWLGFAGLVPFAGCLAVLLVADAPRWQALAATTLQHYAAIIAAFLGAVHWGIAAIVEDDTRIARLRWGITPALISWALLILPTPAAMLGFAALFALILAVDLYLLPALDDDYRALRRPLSIAVIAVLVLAAFVSPGAATPA